MKSNISFAEILSSKIEEKDFKQNSISEKTQMSDPYALAYMLGHFDKYEFKKSTKDCFSRSKNDYGFNKYPIQTRKNHQFNESQEISFQFFQNHLEQFERNFLKLELKKAFRHLAIKHHPDHGGSALLFIELKKHYETLLLIFK